MIRRPPRSTRVRSSAASDVYKRQLFPLIYNGVVAFRHWSLLNPAADGWAGFENFSRLVNDEKFWNALTNTFGIFILSTIPQLFLALIIAAPVSYTHLTLPTI